MRNGGLLRSWRRDRGPIAPPDAGVRGGCRSGRNRRPRPRGSLRPDRGHAGAGPLLRLGKAGRGIVLCRAGCSPFVEVQELGHAGSRAPSPDVVWMLYGVTTPDWETAESWSGIHQVPLAEGVASGRRLTFTATRGRDRPAATLSSIRSGERFRWFSGRATSARSITPQALRHRFLAARDAEPGSRGRVAPRRWMRLLGIVVGVLGYRNPEE